MSDAIKQALVASILRVRKRFDVPGPWRNWADDVAAGKNIPAAQIYAPAAWAEERAQNGPEDQRPLARAAQFVARAALQHAIHGAAADTDVMAAIDRVDLELTDL